MSESPAIPAPATTAPAAAPPAPPAAAAPAPAAAAPAAAAPADQSDPAWLEGRLARAKESERRAILNELGIDDPIKAKAALAAAKAAEEANKSSEQRAAELAAKLGTTQAEAERLRGIASEHAGRMMAVLTDEQKAAVVAIAGDDPAAQLRTIGALAPTWAKQAAPTTDAAPAAPKPATTAPAAAAPAAVSPGSPPDHKSTYSQLRHSNPFEAAAYGLAHPEAYEVKPA